MPAKTFSGLTYSQIVNRIQRVDRQRGTRNERRCDTRRRSMPQSCSAQLQQLTVTQGLDQAHEAMNIIEIPVFYETV